MASRFFYITIVILPNEQIAPYYFKIFLQVFRKQIIFLFYSLCNRLHNSILDPLLP